MTTEQRAELAARRAEVVTWLRADAEAHSRIFPLSFSQRSLWFVHQEDPASAAYSVAFQARIVSAVDVAALRQALQALLDRHAALRTTYPVLDGVPVQRVAGAANVSFHVHDVKGISDDALGARVRADYARPFDLAVGPVFRATLFTRAAEDHVFLVVAHHIAVDGWSLVQVVDELRVLYAEATGGATAPLPRAEAQYSDFVAWQAEMLAGPEGERLEQYWRRQLGGALASLDLPTDRARPAVRSGKGASVGFTLDADLSAALRMVARAEGTTPFVVLLAAFKTLLFRYTASEELIVSTPTFGRGRPEFARVVGDFVNTIPLRSSLDAALAFRDLVARERQVVLDALDAQEFPFPRIVEAVRPARKPGRSPVVDVLFVLQRFDGAKDLEPVMSPQGEGAPAVDFGGLKLKHYPLEQQQGQFDLTLEVIDGTGMLSGSFKYDANLFDRGTIQRMSDHFRRLLAGIAAGPRANSGCVAAADHRGGAVAHGNRQCDGRAVSGDSDAA